MSHSLPPIASVSSSALGARLAKVHQRGALHVDAHAPVQTLRRPAPGSLARALGCLWLGVQKKVSWGMCCFFGFFGLCSCCLGIWGRGRGCNKSLLHHKRATTFHGDMLKVLPAQTGHRAVVRSPFWGLRQAPNGERGETIRRPKAVSQPWALQNKLGMLDRAFVADLLYLFLAMGALCADVLKKTKVSQWPIILRPGIIRPT